jgi:hypothetical protein
MHAPLTHSMSPENRAIATKANVFRAAPGFFFSRSWTAFSSASSFSKSFLRAAIRSESASADCCPASRLPLTRMPAESTQVPPVSVTFLVGVCKLDVLLVLLRLSLRGGLVLLLLLIDRTGCARSCSAGEVLGAPGRIGESSKEVFRMGWLLLVTRQKRATSRLPLMVGRHFADSGIYFDTAARAESCHGWSRRRFKHSRILPAAHTT